MQRKLNKIAKDTNLFLRRFIAKQKKSNLIVAMKYGLFSGGKKIRSKILIDVGFLFKLDYKTLIVIGADIGLLFQVADDLIYYKGSLIVAGKKTGKDKKKGKATLISLLGYKNTIKYANNLILRIKSKLKKYGSKSRNLSETLNYILNRNK